MQDCDTPTVEAWYKHAKLRRVADANIRYHRMTATISKEWTMSDVVCGCKSSNKNMHCMINVRQTGHDQEEVAMCPILYYLNLARMALRENTQCPSRELFNQLLERE